MDVHSFENLNKLAAAHKLISRDTLQIAQLCTSKQPVQEKNTGSTNSTNTSTCRVIRTKLFEWRPPSKIATKFILAGT